MIWTSCRDLAGRTYYLNRQTGEKRWRKPEIVLEAKADISPPNSSSATATVLNHRLKLIQLLVAEHGESISSSGSYLWRVGKANGLWCQGMLEAKQISSKVQQLEESDVTPENSEKWLSTKQDMKELRIITSFETGPLQPTNTEPTSPAQSINSMFDSASVVSAPHSEPVATLGRLFAALVICSDDINKHTLPKNDPRLPSSAEEEIHVINNLITASRLSLIDQFNVRKGNKDNEKSEKMEKEKKNNGSACGTARNAHSSIPLREILHRIKNGKLSKEEVLVEIYACTLLAHYQLRQKIVSESVLPPKVHCANWLIHENDVQGEEKSPATFVEEIEHDEEEDYYSPHPPPFSPTTLNLKTIQKNEHLSEDKSEGEGKKPLLGEKRIQDTKSAFTTAITLNHCAYTLLTSPLFNRKYDIPIGCASGCTVGDAIVQNRSFLADLLSRCISALFSMAVGTHKEERLARMDPAMLIKRLLGAAKQIAAVDPGCPEAFEVSGIAQMQSGNFSESAAAFLKASKMYNSPRRVFCLYSMATAVMRSISSGSTTIAKVKKLHKLGNDAEKKSKALHGPVCCHPGKALLLRILAAHEGASPNTKLRISLFDTERVAGRMGGGVDGGPGQGQGLYMQAQRPLSPRGRAMQAEAHAMARKERNRKRQNLGK
eukprot:g5016.t1